MKRSKASASDPPKKRAFIVPEEPADPIEDEPSAHEAQAQERGETLNLVEDQVPTIEDLADLIEINDLEAVGQKLEGLKKTIENMKDNKVRPVWASLHKIWYTLGHLKNEMNNQKHAGYEQDKYEGMCRRLYAWMKHVEKVDPKLALPEKSSFFSSYKK